MVFGKGKFKISPTLEMRLGKYGDTDVEVLKFPDRSIQVRVKVLHPGLDDTAVWDPNDFDRMANDIRHAVALLEVYGG